MARSKENEFEALYRQHGPALLLFALAISGDRGRASVAVSSSGATLSYTVTTSAAWLGFDVGDGSLCTAGGPRFIVLTSDNVVHSVGGCPTANAQPAPAPGWQRYRFGPAQLSPVIAPGATIKSIAVTLDVGPDSRGGMVVLDNIDVNGSIIGHE